MGQAKSESVPGAESFAASIRNLPHRELWDAIEHEVARLKPGIVLADYDCAELAALVAEMRRRLSAWFLWLDGEIQPLSTFSAEAECPKCGAAAKKIRTNYCAGGWKDREACCFLRQDAQAEHMHRKCRCGFEWLEACPEPARPRP